MSDRVDRKLQEVAVAHYGYRHEAEFAGGFLSDAGIPFRLQIDDPAMGLAVSASATIWVLGMDAERAREVLDIDRSHTPRLHSPTRVSQRSLSPQRDGSALLPRERLFAVFSAIGLAALGRILFADGGSTWLQAALGALVVGLVLVGLIGRAPRVVRVLLGALAGSAP